MQLGVLFKNLSLAELSNLSIGNEGSGSIKESQHPKLIGYVNDGLMALFTRFRLQEKTVIIEMVAHITQYHLLTKYAESSESSSDEVPYHYIKDMLRDRFEGDVVKILEVYDSLGNKRVLNDPDNSKSLFTPNPLTLLVPLPYEGEALGVSYQAHHRKLRDNGNNILTQNIDIPAIYESPLQSYVAYKVYSHMNTEEQKKIAQEHYQTYDNTCIGIETNDFTNNTSSASQNKLDVRGFA
jgi:hypothetical protein